MEPVFLGPPLSETPRRVVSLVPSVTETLFDLGVGSSLVAVTDFCIFPRRIDVPRVGGTKNPDVAAIRALAPDLVHMNFEENVRRSGEALAEFTTVCVTEPKSVSDVDDLLGMLGELHDCAAAADGWRAQLAEERDAATGQPFSFAVPIWKNPWMWCGGDTYVSDLVRIAGGRNVLGSRERYPIVPMEDVLALEPDAVFLPDEPYAFTADDAALFRQHARRVIGPFPGHLFTWHGTRTVEGLRFLRQTLG